MSKTISSSSEEYMTIDEYKQTHSIATRPGLLSNSHAFLAQKFVATFVNPRGPTSQGMLCNIFTTGCGSIRLGIVCVYFKAAFWIKLEFMQKYGYLKPLSGDSESLYSDVAVEGAVKEIQRFGGIPETGLIDNKTLELMQSARCGVPDIIERRNKRYVLGSNLGWNKRKLTYFIANWSPKLGQLTVQTELQKSFDAWARYGRLNFQETSDPNADIIVSFHRGQHGDGYPFDGPGSVLAHAFFPNEMGSYGGDIHFDDDEVWKVNPGEFEDGVDFFTVAVHELGHSLGLAHSPMPDSIMNPYYKRNTANFNLGYDDILAMYELYIKRNLSGDNKEPNTTGNVDNEDNDNEGNSDESTSSKPTTETESTTSRSSEPTTSRYTITFEGDDESVIVHKKHDKMHRIPDSVPPLMPDDMTPTTESSVDFTSPDGCKGNFDSVVNLRGELFIFKDEWLWRLSKPGTDKKSGPIKIQRLFNQLPSTVKKIDAAYQRDTDGNIILFTGDKYWVFDGNYFVENSPRSITDLGLPDYLSHIDAAMVWEKNKRTYLFSGNRYWRYNDITHAMDSDYPKSISMFNGVPSDLDAALTWTDGITYFFKNEDYWAFNNTWKKTEAGYPKSATNYLFNCS